MQARIRRGFFTAAAVAVILCGLGATHAWSATGGADVAGTCPKVSCVESVEGRFCLCRAGADVCAGEHAVTSCSDSSRQTPVARRVCCESPAGFCYCSADAACTDPDDRPTDRCDATLRPIPAARCALAL